MRGRAPRDRQPDRLVRISVTDNGKGSVSKAMEADELGVEDENFLDTSVALYEERENILEMLNQNFDD